MTAQIDAWIALQPDPRPSRSDAIRRLLDIALTGQRATKSLDEKIARAKRKIAGNPADQERSPSSGMSTLRRGLAENDLRTLREKKRNSRPANGT